MKSSREDRNQFGLIGFALFSFGRCAFDFESTFLDPKIWIRWWGDNWSFIFFWNRSGFWILRQHRTMIIWNIFPHFSDTNLIRFPFERTWVIQKSRCISFLDSAYACFCCYYFKQSLKVVIFQEQFLYRVWNFWRKKGYEYLRKISWMKNCWIPPSHHPLTMFWTVFKIFKNRYFEIHFKFSF